MFYQNTSNRLAGVVYVSGSGWSSVVEFTNTISTDWPLVDAMGSGLSVVNYPTTTPKGIRVYHQDPSGHLTWWTAKAVDTANEKWTNGTIPHPMM